MARERLFNTKIQNMLESFEGFFNMVYQARYFIPEAEREAVMRKARMALQPDGMCFIAVQDSWLKDEVEMLLHKYFGKVELRKGEDLKAKYLDHIWYFIATEPRALELIEGMEDIRANHIRADQIAEEQIILDIKIERQVNVKIYK